MDFRRLEDMADWLENHPVKTTRTETTTRKVTICDLCPGEHASRTCYRCGKDLCIACFREGRAVDLCPDKTEFGRFDGPYFCAGCEGLSRAERDPVFSPLLQSAAAETIFRATKDRHYHAQRERFAEIERLVEAARERHEGEGPA